MLNHLKDYVFKSKTRRCSFASFGFVVGYNVCTHYLRSVLRDKNEAIVVNEITVYVLSMGKID